MNDSRSNLKPEFLFNTELVEVSIRTFLSQAAAAVPHFLYGISKAGHPHHGHVGTTLFADNARILFVNGVGSRERHCREKAQEISRIFDNCRDDYTYIPLTFSDAHRAVKDRIEPAGSTLLIATIERLYREIQENQLPPSAQASHRLLNGGERIICIVHSGGGGTFETIRNHLSPEILDRIDIVSIGSAALFTDHRFRRIRNFVGKNDLVPFVCSALFGNLAALVHEHTQYLPVRHRENPIASHQMTSHTYRSALEQLRDEYAPELCAS